MIKVSQITKIDEVMPYVWNIVFQLNDEPFQYTTDLLYLRRENSWAISRKIPHELTSLLAHGSCPLCHHNGISCQVATKEVETIIQSVLQHPSFQEKTLKVMSPNVNDPCISYQFVNNKRDWSELYENN